MIICRRPRNGALLDFSLVAPGGSRTYAAGFLNALARRGSNDGRFMVLLPAAPHELVDEEDKLRRAGIEVQRIGSTRPAGTWASRIAGQLALPFVVARRRPLVTFVPREAGPILLSGRRVLLARNVLRWQRADRRRRPLPTQIRAAMTDRVASHGIRRAARTIVPSSVIGEMLPAGTHYEVIPYGVELDPAPLNELPSLIRQPLRVVTLGALTRHKRIDVIMDAVAALAARNVDVLLDLWGPVLQDDEVDRLRHHADQVLGRRCTFRGPVDPAARSEVLRSADVLALGSGTESFGFPMIEAMRSGTLVLAPDAPITREVCGPVALYFEPGDSDDAADRLTELLYQGAGEITARRAAGVERSLGFTWDRCVDETLAVLEVVAGIGQAGPD